MIIIILINRLTHLRWRNPKGLTNLGIEFPDVAEALNTAGGATVSELGVEDEARPHAAGWRRQTLRSGPFSQPNDTPI